MPVASVAHLQPFLGLALAAALLHEQVTWLMQLSAAMVIGCVAAARRFAR